MFVFQSYSTLKVQIHFVGSISGVVSMNTPCILENDFGMIPLGHLLFFVNQCLYCEPLNTWGVTELIKVYVKWEDSIEGKNGNLQILKGFLKN